MKSVGYDACYVYLGHHATVALYNSPDDFIFFEEEKLTRQKGGEFIPYRCFLKVRKYSVKRIFILNDYGMLDWQAIARSLGFSAAPNRPPVYQVRINHHYTHAVSALLFRRLDTLHSGERAHESFDIMISDGVGHECESVTRFRGESAKLKIVDRFRFHRLSLGQIFERLVCHRDTGFEAYKDEYKTLGYAARIHTILSPGRQRRLLSIIKRVAHAMVVGSSDRFSREIRRDLESYTQGSPKFDERLPADVANEDVSEIEIRREPGDIRLLRRIAKDHRIALNSTTTYNVFPNLKALKDVLLKRESYVFMRGLYTKDLETNRILASFVGNEFLKAWYEAYFQRRTPGSNLLLGGGVHYNVDLNRRILKARPGYVAATPLAGDIAHASAYIHLREPNFRPRNLNWIPRKLRPLEYMRRDKGVFYTQSSDEFNEIVAELLRTNRLVNLMKGRGEYGPRALLNTSTIALPTLENKQRIDRMNGRDSHMAMAPALNEEDLEFFFRREQYERVAGSLAYMIMCLDYRDDVDHEKYGGVMQFDPEDDVWTGRPQVVYRDNQANHELLAKIRQATDYRSIINTSFNRHGKATALHLHQAWSDFEFQRKACARNGEESPCLVIGDFDA